MSDGNYLHNVSGKLKNNGRVWTELDAIATVDGGKSLVINLSPVGGKRLLSIGAEDAGAVLKSRLLREHRRWQARNKGRIRRHDPGQHCYRSGAD